MNLKPERRTIELSYPPRGDVIEINGVLYRPSERRSRTLVELTVKEFHELLKELDK